MEPTETEPGPIRRRIIVLAGAVPAVVLAVLGLLNAVEVTHLSAEVLGTLGAALGIISAAVVTWVRAVAKEIVYVVLASTVGVVSAVVTILNALEVTNLDDMQAGAIATAATIITATITAALRAEVTSPANVAALQNELVAYQSTSA